MIRKDNDESKVCEAYFVASLDLQLHGSGNRIDNGSFSTDISLPPVETKLERVDCVGDLIRPCLCWFMW